MRCSVENKPKSVEKVFMKSVKKVFQLLINIANWV